MVSCVGDALRSCLPASCADHKVQYVALCEALNLHDSHLLCRLSLWQCGPVSLITLSLLPLATGWAFWWYFARHAAYSWFLQNGRLPPRPMTSALASSLLTVVCPRSDVGRAALQS